MASCMHTEDRLRMTELSRVVRVRIASSERPGTGRPRSTSSDVLRDDQPVCRVEQPVVAGVPDLCEGNLPPHVASVLAQQCAESGEAEHTLPELTVQVDV